ncbi:MAG: LamG-like jellyroll fold domain-containing protein [Bacteroidales bacterium]
MKTTTRHLLVFFALFILGFQSFAQTQSPLKALSYDGVNDYVSGASGISTSLTAITIEAWVYHNTLPAGVVQRYVTINPEVAVLRYDGSGGVNNLHFYIKKTNGTLYALQANNVLSTGTWMHVAGTYDGTNMKLYLNGKLLSSATPAGGLYPPSGSFSFSASGSEAFNGKMDEVSVWNSARTATDIREDMYRSAPLANANLKNYWQFNNGSGTTLTDLKGTATGTLQNGPTWVASTIPFAAGCVNTQIVFEALPKTFPGTGLIMDYTGIGGTDTVAVSRIDTLPNVKPTGVQHVYDNQYWVINHYGTNNFNTNLIFTLSEGITTAQQSGPNRVLLYSRSGNSDGAWTFVTSASSLNATNGTATFDGLNGATGLGKQYIVCNNFPQTLPGTALNFDGTNDYVNCGNASGLNITGAITIEAWINADNWKANSWEGTIVGKDNTNATGYNLRCGNNGMLSFLVGAGGAWNEVLSGPVMSTGRWNCVAGVYDGTTMYIYINGLLSGQQALSSAIGVSAQSLFIGNSPGYPTRFFDGKIDEVRIWNVARSQSQIQSDMYNTLAGTETGLVDYWQFNNGTGTTLTDLVGSSSGTLTNMDAATCWIESYAMVVPVPIAASNITSAGFTANWTAPAIGSVTSYKLDVSTNNTFTSLVSGYNNVDCGNNLSKVVTGLTAGTTYYYRVRADKTSVTGTGANHFTYTSVCTPFSIISQSTATQTQPLNGTFTPITVTATGNVTYQWYSNANATNSGGTSLGSDNGAQTYSYTPQATTLGTLYYYCVVSGTCGASQTSAVSGAIIVNTVVAGITGTGTASDPYQIATLDNLNWLQSMNHSMYWQFHYIQTADINAAASRNWDSGNGFSPIGRFSIPSFTGTYNGKGHTIDSIYINRTGAGYVGFFGQINNAKIDSLNLTNVSITSNNGHIGALVGIISSNSTVNHCSSSGSVNVSMINSNIGGLIGTVSANTDTIKYCYSTAIVNCSGTSNNYTGGFIGKNSGIITQCYACGLVTGSGTYLGGFVGQSTNADQCYWDNQTSGQISGGTQSGTGTWNLYGKSTTEMKTQDTYTGWDFTNNWYISTNANNGYPCFYYAPELSTQAVNNIKTFTATAHGTIVSKGAATIAAYGVCYNTTGLPTTADARLNLGSASYFGAFTANMSGLHHGTTYYVRAYAINERDTIYGGQVSFTTTNVTQANTCLNNGDQYNYISIPNNSSLQLTNNYSIEVWLKPGVAVTTNRIIVSKGYNANGYTLLSNGSGNKRGLIFDGMATADNILTQNQWCHVAAVNDNGTRHLYLNGVEMPLTGTPVSVTANTQPLYLSNYDNGGSSNCFRGYIEELRIWNSPLSFSQIRENMHLPLTGTESGLVSYWQFDEGQPPTVFDKKGVNNGTWYASVINQYTNSTIPFGTGFSHTSVVNATGNYDFTNTGLSINFTAKSGPDSIVVAKIDTFPNLNPNGLPAVFDRQYWVVHKYGTGSLTANLTFTPAEDLTMQDQANPANLKLYTRSSMADDASWILLASATSVNAATNQATFEGITGFSQFIIGKTLLVPANQTVANTTIHNGETECFNATEVVSVSNFTVETGGDVTIIAGGQIHFTPGVVVQPGGYLHGYITTTQEYCGTGSTMAAPVTLGEEEISSLGGGSWFKLYPNPTSGTFTLDLTGVENRAEVHMEIYSMHGEKILQAEMYRENQRTFCIGAAASGIYIIRISAGNETVFGKLVKM